VNHPDDDDLAALALGEPTPAAVAEHAHSCASCSQALDIMRNAVAALRDPVPHLAAPPASVWDAVLTDIDREPDAGPVPVEHAAPDASPVPVVHAGPGPVVHPPAGDEAAPAPPPQTDDLAGRRAATSARRRFPVAWVAAAAAAGLVVGAVGARVLGNEPSQAPVTVARTDLDTLDTKQVKGSADVVRRDGRLALAVNTAPIDPGDGYLEVWLINKDLKRMVSVGVLPGGDTRQSFVIPQDLLDQGYVIVDISREGFDDAPEHSGDSLVRGTLPT
jgi:hypothetical protein